MELHFYQKQYLQSLIDIQRRWVIEATIRFDLTFHRFNPKRELDRYDHIGHLTKTQAMRRNYLVKIINGKVKLKDSETEYQRMRVCESNLRDSKLKFKALTIAKRRKKND